MKKYKVEMTNGITLVDAESKQQALEIAVKYFGLSRFEGMDEEPEQATEDELEDYKRMGGIAIEAMDCNEISCGLPYMIFKPIED